MPRASPTCPFLGKEALNHSPLGRISFSLKQQSKSIDVGLLDSVHRGLRTAPVGPIAQVDELGAGARGGLPSAWAAVAASWRGPRAAVERNPATVGALVRCRASRNLSPSCGLSGFTAPGAAARPGLFFAPAQASDAQWSVTSQSELSGRRPAALRSARSVQRCGVNSSAARTSGTWASCLACRHGGVLPVLGWCGHPSSLPCQMTYCVAKTRGRLCGSSGRRRAAGVGGVLGVSVGIVG